MTNEQKIDFKEWALYTLEHGIWRKYLTPNFSMTRFKYNVILRKYMLLTGTPKDADKVLINIIDTFVPYGVINMAYSNRKEREKVYEQFRRMAIDLVIENIDTFEKELNFHIDRDWYITYPKPL